MGSTTLNMGKGKFSRTGVDSKLTSGVLFNTLGAGKNDRYNTIFTTSTDNEVKGRTTMNGFRILDQSEIHKIFRDKNDEKNEKKRRIEVIRDLNLKKNRKTPKILRSKRIKNLSKDSLLLSNQSISGIDNTEILNDMLDDEEKNILSRTLKHNEKVKKARKEGKVKGILKLSDIRIGKEKKLEGGRRFKIEDYKSLRDYSKEVE